MAETPTPEMRERLRTLCKQITVAEDIDPEIQEELLTHMEDKFAAFRYGSEPITDEDALILVREHFGDPGIMKALLQHTHVEKADLSLGRRLAAIAVVTLSFYAVIRFLNAFSTTTLVWFAQRYATGSILWGSVWTAQNMFLACSLAPLTWYIVRRWRRQLDRGVKPWFVRWSPIRLLLLVIGSCFVTQSVPQFAFTDSTFGIPASAARATMFAGMGLGVTWIAMVLQSTAWLWWCDRPPRTGRALSYATLTWAFVGSWVSLPGSTAGIRTDEVVDYFTLIKLVVTDANLWWSGTIPFSALTLSYIVLTFVHGIRRNRLRGPRCLLDCAAYDKHARRYDTSRPPRFSVLLQPVDSHREIAVGSSLRYRTTELQQNLSFRSRRVL